jgi:predicted RNase H-like HicB family nuclease
MAVNMAALPLSVNRATIWLLARSTVSLSNQALRNKVNRMRYAIVIENAGGNFSAYVPDLPGCVATGPTVAEAEQNLREAIAFHLDGMREDGTPIPPPSSRVDYVEVAA